jgi:hypothetical protein
LKHIPVEERSGTKERQLQHQHEKEPPSVEMLEGESEFLELIGV